MTLLILFGFMSGPEAPARSTRSRVDFSTTPAPVFYHQFGADLGFNRPPVSRYPGTLHFTPANSLPSSSSGRASSAVPVSDHLGSTGPSPPVSVAAVGVSSLPDSSAANMSSSFGYGGGSLAPKSFAGTDAERVDEFLGIYNWYTKLHKWDDETKCQGLRRFLEGRAKLWFEAIVNRCQATPAPAATEATADSEEDEKGTAAVSPTLLTNWSLLEADMKKTFAARDIPMLIRHTLQTRHQFANEKVMDYALTMQSMMNKVDPLMKEEQKLHYFLFGLQPAYYLEVQRAFPTLNNVTFDQAVDAAKRYEEALMIATGAGAAIHNINHYGMPQQPFMNPMLSGMMMPPQAAMFYGGGVDPFAYDVNAVSTGRQFGGRPSSGLPTAVNVNNTTSSSSNNNDVMKKLFDELADLKKQVMESKGSVSGSGAGQVGFHFSNNNRGGMNGYQHQPGWVNPSSARCFYCGIAGHTKARCRKLARDEERARMNQNFNDTQGSSSNNSGGGSGQLPPRSSSSSNAAGGGYGHGNPGNRSSAEEKKNDSVNTLTASVNTIDEKNDVSGTSASVYSVSPTQIRPLSVDGNVGGAAVEEVLIDTGASITVISAELLRRLNIQPQSLTPTAVRVRDASASSLNPIGAIRLNVELHRVSIGEVEFVVLQNLNAEAIIGSDVLHKHFKGINFEDGKLAYKNELIPLNNCLNPSRNIFEIFLLRDVFIPPFGEVLTRATSIRGDLTRSQTDDVVAMAKESGAVAMVEPVAIRGLEEKVRAARSVLSVNYLCCDSVPDRGIPVRLSNFTDRVVELGADVPIANVELVEVESVLPATHLSMEELEVNNIVALDSVANSTTATGDESTVKPEDVAKAIKTTKQGEAEKLSALLHKYPQLFAANPKKPTQTTKTTHSIDTGDAKPIKLPPYRNARVDDEHIEKEIAGLLSNGLIRRSNSPWSAPVVIVMKKGGERRTCIDYRKLNAVTKKCSYPLPRVEDLIDSLGTKDGRKKYFSKLDLASAYWSVKIDEKDREKTAFVTKQGLFEWLVMPFGLCNAPATFQRLMDEVFAELKFKCVVVYFDDIVIFSDSFEEHIVHLELVFKKLTDAHLQAKLVKCQFGLEEVSFLGFIIGPEGVKPDPDTVRSVAEFRVPKTVRDLRSFLGLASFYRSFIAGFAGIATPLHQLTKKDIVFVWNDEAHAAFNHLKHALTSAPILATPEFGKPFTLTTDASRYALGAVLSQMKEGKERVIRYASRTMNAAERRYSVTEQECLAIVWAIGVYRCYLLGIHFTIVTDHKPLVSLPKLKLDDPYGRLARWTLKLQHYDYDVVYTKGSLNTNADALSRITEIDEAEAGVDEEELEAKYQNDGGRTASGIDQTKEGDGVVNEVGVEAEERAREIDLLIGSHRQ